MNKPLPSDAKKIELCTKRLRLRQWRVSDRAPFAVLNADPSVMQYYPNPLDVQASDAFADRCKSLIDQRGWGFWAVELLDGQDFIGFVGLNIPNYELAFAPCIEIGWRLARSYWGKGYASEAAEAALRAGFELLNFTEIVSFTTMTNLKSRAVMEKIHMRPAGVFEHPLVPAGHPLRPHCLYRITKQQWSDQR